MRDPPRFIVWVLEGRGDGSFEAAWGFSMGGESAFVVVGNFDSDGKQDVAAANAFAGAVSVLLGGGDGSFRWAGDFRVGSAPASITVGDFNNDGRPDVATANPASSDVSVLINGTP